MKSVPTGIENLDSALMMGVPTGYTILLSGTPGSGIELFAKQFASSYIPGEYSLYITTNERTEDILNTMKNFKWKTENITIINIGEAFYKRVLEKEIIISKYREEGIPAEEILKPHKFKLEKEFEIITLVKYALSMVKTPYRLVLDSLDFLFSQTEHTEALSTVRTIKMHTQYTQGISLLTQVSSLYPSMVQNAIEEIVDIIFTMENVRTPLGFDRIFTIKKFRNFPDKVGVFKYNLTTTGITISKIVH